VNYITRYGQRIEVETLNAAGVTVNKTRRREHKAFAKVPLEWAAKAAKATNTTKAMVWLILLHAAWEANRASVPLPNGKLKRVGVTRYAKYRTLKELQAGGLITVERNRGKAPTVTILESVALAHRSRSAGAQVA
jgi:hypothetical protein